MNLAKKSAPLCQKAITLQEGDEIIGVEYIQEDSEILLASSTGRCVRFKQEKLRSLSRLSMGVRGMRIGKEETIVAMTVIKPNTQIVTISENGFAKRTAVENYRLTARGAKGVKAGVFNDKTGPLKVLLQVDIAEDLMLIADNGTIIRTAVSEIRELSRTSIGVKVMKLRNGTTLSCATKTEHIVEKIDVLSEEEVALEKLEEQEDLSVPEDE